MCSSSSQLLEIHQLEAASLEPSQGSLLPVHMPDFSYGVVFVIIGLGPTFLQYDLIFYNNPVFFP